MFDGHFLRHPNPLRVILILCHTQLLVGISTYFCYWSIVGYRTISSLETDNRKFCTAIYGAKQVGVKRAAGRPGLSNHALAWPVENITLIISTTASCGLSGGIGYGWL